MKARRAVTIVFYAAVAALLGLYLSRLDYRALASIDLAWSYLAAAAAVLLAQRFTIPLAWVLVVRDLGVAVPRARYPTYNFVYAKAWLGRYLPGKVAMVAARIYFAEQLGAPRSVVAVSSAAELGAQLLVGAVLGLAGVASVAPRTGDPIADYRVFAYALIAGLALLLWPPVFNALIRAAYRIARRPIGEGARVGASTIAWAAGGFVVVTALTGVFAVLVGAAVDPRALAQPIFIGGAYVLAGTLGMAFLFAPSGLGAREAVQLPLLAMILPAEAALAIVLLSRLGEVAIDGVFYAASAAWARAAVRQAIEPPPE